MFELKQIGRPFRRDGRRRHLPARTGELVGKLEVVCGETVHLSEMAAEARSGAVLPNV